MEEPLAAGRAPDHLDAEALARVEVDVVVGLEASERQRRWRPPVEPQGGRRARRPPRRAAPRRRPCSPAASSGGVDRARSTARSRSSTRRQTAVNPLRPARGRRRRRAAQSTSAGSAISTTKIQPRAVRVGVDLLGGVVECGVDLDDRARDRREDLRHRLRRLDLGAPGVGHHVGADAGELHVDDVTERVLREVGDADPRLRAVDGDPLVFLAVPQLLGEFHGEKLPARPSISKLTVAGARELRDVRERG